VALSDATDGRLWTEMATATTATTLITYLDGPLAGGPALTRHPYGRGIAYYLTTQLELGDLRALLGRLAGAAGVTAPVAAPPGVDVVRRRHPDGRGYTFLANHNAEPVEVDLPGKVLTGGEAVAGGVRVPAGGLAVVAHTEPSG
jgi:beta-galactosidase